MEFLHATWKILEFLRLSNKCIIAASVERYTSLMKIAMKENLVYEYSAVKYECVHILSSHAVIDDSCLALWMDGWTDGWLVGWLAKCACLCDCVY